IFAFLVACLYSNSKFMHSAVVLFIFGEREAKTVPRGEITHNSRQTRAVILRSIDAQCFASSLLGEIPGAPVETDAQPAGQRFSDRHQEFEECAKIRRERTERRIRANQNLFSGITIFIEDWRDSIRQPDDGGL